MQRRIVCSAFLAAFLVVFSPLAVRAQLDADFRIGGGILVGPSTTTCDGTKTGGLRWSSAELTFEMCDGASWQKIAASTCDSAPAFFIFTDQSMLTTSTLVTSNIVSITGMDAGCSASVGVSGTGGSPEYRICSTSNCSSVDIDWTAGNNTLAMQGKYMQLRATTSASAGTTFTITANIGTTDSDWDIMTQHADCSGNPVGTVCGDGTVYAGTSPDGSVPMFVTRCDAGQSWTGSCTGTRQTKTWTDGNNFPVDTAVVGCGTASGCAASGETNTAILINTDSNYSAGGQQNHVAAQYCADLSLHGYTDWYLPSSREIDVMYSNRVAISNFLTDGNAYWSSSETSLVGRSWEQNFNTGAFTNNITYNTAYVRCVRRNADVTPTSLSFTDQTNQAAAALILSNIVQITGIDTATSVAIVNKSADGTGTPEYRICSDSSCAGVVTGWNSAINPISNNQYVQARMYANGTPGAVNSAAIIVGDLSDQWSLTTSAADPCAGSPSPGAVCADGTVYAGLSPDGNVAMYTTRCMGGQTWSAGSCTGSVASTSWNDGNSNWVDTVLVNCAVLGGCNPSGESNTAILINVDSNSVTSGVQAHAAAQACADLNMDGYTDWYLPSVDELNVVYTNRVVIGNYYGSWTRSSSEGSSSLSGVINFNNGSVEINTGGNTKATGLVYRCVRRDVDITPAALSFTDLTNQTAAALVTSNIFQVTGLGAATSVAVASKSADGSGNPEYRICSDSSCTGVVTGWNSSVNAISNNQYVQLRMYANGAASAVNSALVIVGDITDQWDVTTSSSDPCAGSPSPGAVCTDGSVYAGLSPDGNVAMYVPRCDAGQTWGASGCVNARTPHSWNAGNGGGLVNTTLADCGSAPGGCAVSGETNTNTLITEDADSITGGTQPHAAAQYCADLNIHGQTDWYLPSAQELNVIYGNRVAIGSFDTSGSIAGWYWSSSENNIPYAWSMRFSDGLWNANPTGSKPNSYQVRCARK